MMKILVAPDSFKRSLSSAEAAAVMARAVAGVFPAGKITEIPLSDGGEGFTAALVRAAGGTMKEVPVHDPLMRPVKAVMGLLDRGRTAVIEMAAASGLELLAPEEYNPLITSTYGTGELIRAALDQGCRRILVGVGGSATVDGGAGALQALGVRFLDRYGNELPPGGGALGKLEKIDISPMDKRLKDIIIEVACDVTNPLTGAEGAAMVYAPQKGADAGMTRRLADNLEHLAGKFRTDLGKDIATLPRAGAAGGLAGGLAAGLGARLREGFEVVSEITGLEKILPKINMVLTGEGHTDRQTLYGKAPHALAKMAGRYNIPVLLFTGGVDMEDAEELEKVFTGIFPVNPSLIPVEEAIHKTAVHLHFTVTQTMKLVAARPGTSSGRKNTPA